MVTKINKVFTPSRRKALYAVVTAAVAAAISFNLITADQLNAAVQGTLSVITALTTLLAAFNASAGPHDQ
jgi:hypothetical protein